MRVGNFSVVIPEGSERETGYVGLQHGKQYTVRMMSHDHRRCDAVVTIDGKEIGTFRIHGHQSFTLERSPEDHGRFTFYADATEEATKAGIALVPNESRGLIQVRFVPEKYHPPVFRGGPGGQSVSRGWDQGYGAGSLRSMGFTPDREEKTSGGITGLSGHSSQQFTEVGAMPLDESEAVTISIRLVCVPDGPRPLKAATEVARGNAVPPPVG